MDSFGANSGEKEEVESLCDRAILCSPRTSPKCAVRNLNPVVDCHLLHRVHFGLPRSAAENAVEQLEARVFETCSLAKQVDLFCAV